MNKAKWVSISKFLLETGVTKDEIYSRIKSGEWYNGYVIKKSPCQKAKSAKYRREGKIIRWGCIEHFEKWGGIL